MPATKVGSFRGGKARDGGPGRSGVGVVTKPSGSGRFNKPVKMIKGGRQDEYAKLDRAKAKKPS
ncbi:MAG: hypothetical protein ACXABY_23670 [Candidatus Thorarchaeota archaeon]|jgi:hypothetical protein